MRLRLWFAMVMVAGALAPGCAASGDPLPFGLWCDGDEREGAAIVLSIQSVPDTTRYACFSELPSGWTVESTQIGDQGTEVVLDSDKAGSAALRLHLTQACDLQGAARLSSEHGVEQYRLVETDSTRHRSARYFVFEGGCVELEFDMPVGESETRVAIEAALRIMPVPPGSLTRDDVY